MTLKNFFKTKYAMLIVALFICASALTETAISAEIWDIYPDNGRPGDLVEIRGTGFGSSRGTSNVYFNGVAVTSFSTWQSTGVGIRCYVPAGCTTGNVTVTISGVPSIGFPFSVYNTPVLTFVGGNPCQRSEYIYIHGNGLGTSQSSSGQTSYFYFNNNTVQATSYSTWQPNCVMVYVPTGASYGSNNITMRMGSFGTSNTLPVTVVSTAPYITYISESEAKYVSSGTRLITIYGANFGSSGSVDFGGTNCGISYWSANQINAYIPVGTIRNANIRVWSSTYGSYSNDAPFRVTFWDPMNVNVSYKTNERTLNAYSSQMGPSQYMIRDNSTGAIIYNFKRPMQTPIQINRRGSDTSITYTLTAGKSYSFGVRGMMYVSGSMGILQTTAYYFTALLWCDWGADGQFSQSGDLITPTSPYYYTGSTYYYWYNTTSTHPPPIGTTPFTWYSFTVPAAADGKNTILRMACNYSTSIPPTTGTGFVPNYGDVIDLKVSIKAPPDAGIERIVAPGTQPGNRFYKGDQDVVVRLKNFGQPLNNVSIYWSIDGGAESLFNWTGSMKKDSVADIVVGTYDFNQNKNYTIAARTLSPNGEVDANNGNNNASITVTPAPDAGITLITQPSGAFSKGTQTVAVQLRNFGWANLTTTQILWRTQSGVPYTTFNWVGNLATGETEDVVLGSADLNEYKIYNFSAYTNLPDAVADEVPANDAISGDYAPALSPSTFYIGEYPGSSNTFSDLASAGSYISSAGILGNGTLYIVLPDLEIGDLNYTGPFTIGSYPSSGTNNIVIKSESGDPDLVRVEFSPDGTTPYLMSLSGLSNATIEGIEFIINNLYNYGGILNLDNCNGITIKNSIFTNVADADPNPDFTSINMNYNYDVQIMGNSFTDGAIAINEMSYCPRKINIHNNNFVNATWKFVSLEGIPDGNNCTENDVMVKDNIFTGNYATNFGISSTNGTEIMNNIFSGLTGEFDGDAVVYLTNTDPTNFTGQTLIEGNTLTSSLENVSGVYADNVPNILLNDNEISVTSSTITSHGVLLNNCGNSTTPAYVKNSTISNADAIFGTAVSLIGGNVRVNKNLITMPNGDPSLSAVYSSFAEGYICNNRIGSIGSTAVTLSNSDLLFYYNTIATESTTNPALNVGGGSNSIRRNIAQNMGDGPAVMVTAGDVNTIDENNYFTSGSVLGSWSGASAADLLEWQTLSGKDENSSNIEISFSDFVMFDLGLESFNEAIVFDEPIEIGDPMLDEEIQGTDYLGQTRYSYFMGSNNIVPEVQITAQPVGVMDCLGATGKYISTTASVTKGVQARFEWFKDGKSMKELYEDPGDDWAEKASIYMDSLPFVGTTPGLNFDMEGTYACFVRGSGAEPKWTENVLVNALGDALITKEPEDTVVDVGGTAIIEVEAHIVADEGIDDPLFQPEVQWYFNNPTRDSIKNDLSVDGHFTGAGSTILTIRNIDQTLLDGIIQNGVYAVLKGSCNVLTSKSAFVKLYPSFTINEQPEDASACEGSTHTFEITATSGDPEAEITYQWNKNGTAIPGATTENLALTNISAADAAVYNCVVTIQPGGKFETSDDATLTIMQKVNITLQPTNQNLADGDPFTLLVTATGDAPLTYQWLKDGVDIPNATEASYSVTSATTTDGGIYTCEVTNVCGTVTSDPATVTVTPGGMVDVTDLSNGGYILTDNTPNPFADVTKFRFYVPQTSFVRLAITDVFGQDVAVLVNGTVGNGWNDLEVNASELKLASGIYYYTLKSNNYSITNKMVVVR